MENVKISELQRKVLTVLAEEYESDLNCMYIQYIADQCGVSYRVARLAVRALARKGLAEYVRGLFDDDGMVAGSGYCATFKGAFMVNGCHNKETCKNLSTMTTGECEPCWQARRVYEFTEDVGAYKKGDKATREELGEIKFSDLYFGTYEKKYADSRRIVDCTPEPDWFVKAYEKK